MFTWFIINYEPFSCDEVRTECFAHSIQETESRWLLWSLSASAISKDTHKEEAFVAPGFFLQCSARASSFKISGKYMYLFEYVASGAVLVMVSCEGASGQSNRSYDLRFKMRSAQVRRCRCFSHCRCFHMLGGRTNDFEILKCITCTSTRRPPPIAGPDPPAHIT